MNNTINTQTLIMKEFRKDQEGELNKFYQVIKYNKQLKWFKNNVKIIPTWFALEIHLEYHNFIFHSFSIKFRQDVSFIRLRKQSVSNYRVIFFEILFTPVLKYQHFLHGFYEDSFLFNDLLFFACSDLLDFVKIILFFENTTWRYPRSHFRGNFYFQTKFYWLLLVFWCLF